MLTAALLAFGVTAPALAAGATSDRIDGPFVTVVATAHTDTPFGFELMFAECDFLQRVEHPDGSAHETQSCQLTGPFFDFPGTLPDQAFNDSAGECVWGSDYWRSTDGSTVIASSRHLTVTPSGNVHVTSRYAADPLTLEDCGF